MGVNQETLTFPKMFPLKRFDLNGMVKDISCFNAEKLPDIQRKATNEPSKASVKKDITYTDQERLINSLEGGFGFFSLRNRM